MTPPPTPRSAVCTEPAPKSTADVRTAVLLAALLLMLGLVLRGSALDHDALALLNAWVATQQTAAQLWAGLTQLGLGLSSLIVVMAIDRRSGKYLSTWLHALLIGGALTHVMKGALPETRPMATLPLTELHVVGEPLIGGGTMPSGHAMAAAACALLLVQAVRQPLWRWMFVAIAGAVALSRVVLAAHWPSDVCVGAGLGLALMAMLLHTSGITLGKGRRSIPVLSEGLRSPNAQAWIAGGEIAAGLSLLFTRTGYPEGFAMQVLLCAVALTSAVCRLTPRTTWGRLFRRASEGAQPVLNSRARRLLLAFGVAGAAAVWLLQQTDVHQAWTSLGRLSPGWWCAAGLGLLGVHALRATRLQREWRHAGEVSWLRCLRLVLLHNAAVLLLPLRTGEAGYVLMVSRHWQVSWAEATISLTWWRLQDASVLASAALLLLLPLPVVPRAVLAVCALVVLVTVLPHVAARLAKRLGHARLRTHEPFGGWAFCLGQWALKLAVLAGLLLGLGSLDIAMALRGALGGELAGVQPLQGPAGLGSYQTGVWFALDEAARSQAPAWLAAALCAQLFSLGVALVGAALAYVLVTDTAPASDLKRPPAPRHKWFSRSTPRFETDTV